MRKLTCFLENVLKVEAEPQLPPARKAPRELSDCHCCCCSYFSQSCNNNNMLLQEFQT